MTDMPMKNDNPPSTGLLLALDDLWSDMDPRNDYETCRAKYEALRAGIEALQTSRPDADRLAALCALESCRVSFNEDMSLEILAGNLRNLIWNHYGTIRAALKSGDKGRTPQEVDLASQTDAVLRDKNSCSQKRETKPIREWMPIESAPRDGRRIIVRGSYPVASVGFWEEPKDRWNVFQANWVPTHWQFLPPTSEGV